MTMMPMCSSLLPRLEACRFREFACPMKRQRLCHVARGAARTPRNAWKVHGIRRLLARSAPAVPAVGIERNCFSVGKFNRLELSAMDWRASEDVMRRTTCTTNVWRGRAPRASDRPTERRVSNDSRHRGRQVAATPRQGEGAVGKLTDDDRTQADGKFDKLTGAIRE